MHVFEGKLQTWSQYDAKSQCMQYSPGALVGSTDVCIPHESTGYEQQCT